MSFFEFARDQWRHLPVLVSQETCAGKTYIVTGANAGLGFETVKHLVAAGAKKVIMGVRNMSAGAKAKEEIEEATGKRGVAEVWELDMGKFESVKAFAKRIITEVDRIDALVENAGVAQTTWTTTEGFETNMVVNVLSTFLLAVLVLPKLSESAKKHGNLPHLEIVSSEGAFMAREGWEKIRDNPMKKLNDPKTADISKRLGTLALICPLHELVEVHADPCSYPISKLLEILSVRELAGIAPVAKTGVVLNALSPGLCTTRLDRSAGFFLKVQIAIMRALLARSAEEGSRTLLHAATAGKESHGCYLASCEIRE